MADDNTREEIHEDGAAAEEAPPRPSTRSRPLVLDRFPASVFHESHGQPVVYVHRADWHDVATFLRDEQQFTQCMDVTVVDHLLDAERMVVPGVEWERFEVVANYLSHPRNRRLRTICEVPGDAPTVAEHHRPLSRRELRRA